MDISTETSEEKLKAMAYNELRQVQAHQRNLQVIEERLAQLAEHSAIPSEALAQKPSLPEK